MAGTSGIGFGVRMVAGAVLATCVALGAYFTYQTFVVGEDVLTPVTQSEPQSEPVTQTVTAVETTTSPEPPADPTPEVTPEPAPDPAVDTASDPVDVPVIAPSFDVVRIEPDGSSVIAGNAAPNAVVTILLGGTEIGQATADNQGKFVALLNVPSNSEAQVLSLSVQQADDILVVSNDSVILAPIAPPTPQPADVAQVVPDPTTEPSTTEQVIAEQVAVEAPETDPIVTPAAPAVLLANEQGVRVIQPADRSPSVMANVVIDAISYDAQGEVQLSGRGSDQAGEAEFVRVYLNDAAIQTTRIERGGDWHTALPNVDTGIYVLRVDQVDASGAVTSRTETPFKRETVEVLTDAQTANATQSVRAITVQPGSTLWAIARDKYGDGTLYVRVFEANSDSIRNPDLIYPGQVFQVPE